MPELVYILCAITSALCAGLLARSYRRNRTRLLMWSTLCFAGLFLNNLLLVLDLMVVPNLDLSIARQLTALTALMLLVIGLVWESR
jgi:biotin transporter BioY